MLKSIRRLVSNRKLIRHLAEDPSLKDYQKNELVQEEIDQFRKQSLAVTPDSYHSLSSSLKAKKPKYKRFVLPKDKLNKTLRQVILQYTKKGRFEDSEMERKTMQPLMSEAAEIVNEINTNEVQKFKRVNFVQRQTKKLLNREKEVQGNFIGSKIEVQDPELRKKLELVCQPNLKPTEFLEYQNNLNMLKNSKMNDFLFVYGINDEDLPQLYLGEGKSSVSNLLTDKSHDVNTSADRTAEPQTINANTSTFDLQIINPASNLLESQEGDMRTLPTALDQDEQKYLNKNLDLVKLSEKEFELAKSIKKFERDIFLANHETFATPMLFSKLNPETKHYYLKKIMRSPDEILDLFAFYDKKGQKCKEMYLPFYGRVTELFNNRTMWFDKGEYLDLFVISNWKYKKLLWQLLKDIGNMDVKDFVMLLSSYSTLHSREKGELLGKEQYEKINEILTLSIVNVIKENSGVLRDNPEKFSLILKAAEQTDMIFSALIKNDEFLTEVLNISQAMLLEARPEMSGNVSRIFSFLCNVLYQLEVTSDRVQLRNSLKEAATQSLQLIQQNVEVMLNPVNFSDIVFSTLLLANKDTTELATDFIRDCRQHFNEFLLPRLEFKDLHQFTSLMVQCRMFDPSIFTELRKNVIDRFLFVQQLEAPTFYGLVSHMGYLELRHNYRRELYKDGLTDFSTSLLMKLIFSL